MAGDYIPDGDARFDAWQSNFVTYVNDHLADLGLLAADVAGLNGSAASWSSDYPAHGAAQSAARAATEAKQRARNQLKAMIRPLVRRLQAESQVDDGERAAMGITVPDRVATPTGAPVTRPLVRVDSGQRLRHTIHFADEATPTRRAKPSGVMGVEIWVHLAEASAGDAGLGEGAGGPGEGAGAPGALRFLSMDTRTPHVAEYKGADGGQTAHYMLRWVATTGEKGPWSETASATVGV